MKNLSLFAFLLIVPFLAFAQQEAAHLFILSGQSNMAGLNPAESFTPAVEKAFGKDKVIVVNSAQGGQPIRRWSKDWKPAKGDTAKADRKLYVTLMTVVKPAITDREIATVTFLWMQGRRARAKSTARFTAARSKGFWASWKRTWNARI